MPLADIIPESKVAEEPQAATSETYHFATGDVSDYDDLIQEIKEPKQKFVNQEPPTAVPEQKPAEVPLTPRLQSAAQRICEAFERPHPSGEAGCPPHRRGLGGCFQ